MREGLGSTKICSVLNCIRKSVEKKEWNTTIMCLKRTSSPSLATNQIHQENSEMRDRASNFFEVI